MNKSTQITEEELVERINLLHEITEIATNGDEAPSDDYTEKSYKAWLFLYDKLVEIRGEDAGFDDIKSWGW